MLTHRNPLSGIKTRGVSIFWDKLTSEVQMLCKQCPVYSRRESVLGFHWELREPVVMMLREKYKLLN